MDLAFIEGKQAAAQGKQLSDNPYVIGHTKLGSPKLSDDGVRWENGFLSIGRRASEKEVRDANELTDVSRFRKKPNRYYK